MLIILTKITTTFVNRVQCLHISPTITKVVIWVAPKTCYKCKQMNFAHNRLSSPLLGRTCRMERKPLRGAKVAVAIFLPTPLLPHPAENFFWPTQKHFVLLQPEMPREDGA